MQSNREILKRFKKDYQFELSNSGKLDIKDIKVMKLNNITNITLKRLKFEGIQLNNSMRTIGKKISILVDFENQREQAKWLYDKNLGHNCKYSFLKMRCKENGYLIYRQNSTFEAELIDYYNICH